MPMQNIHWQEYVTPSHRWRYGRLKGLDEVIGACVHGGGGAALGVHNANTKDNDDVRLGASRGVMADGIVEQIAELSDLAEASGQKSPIKHVFASPPPGAFWNKAQWEAYWALYEKAQGLEGCPFSESIHDKPGEHSRPDHRHRVYLAITARGTLVRSGNDYIKQEAVSRITEFDTGSALIKGKHNVRAERVTRKLGRDDVADAMIAAGLLNGSRAIAELSPEARAQQERTGVSRNVVAAQVYDAWTHSDNGTALVAALAERGLHLAQGDRCNVLVDASGSIHRLNGLLSTAHKNQGLAAPRAKEIHARLDGIDLLTVDEAKQSLTTASAVIMKDQTEPRFTSIQVSAHPGWAATWSIDGGARASRRSTSTERPFAFAVLTTERNAA